MATQNLVSAERFGFETVEKAPKGRKAYHRPDVVPVGSTIRLVQGNMYSATYRDVCNSGYTYWSNF